MVPIAPSHTRTRSARASVNLVIGSWGQLGHLVIGHWSLVIGHWVIWSSGRSAVARHLISSSHTDPING
ncbi:MAG: hypothetical protein GEU82_04870 [Luteitalea sp.]|nr:hypothetical protein [Luteitalea sp.]